MRHGCGIYGCAGTTRAPSNCWFVALDRGRVCGFTFCVYEGNKAVLGDAYAIAHDPEQVLQITQMLLRHMLDLLDHSPDVERVESQMLLYDSGMIEQPFLEAGFTLFRRLFMEWEGRRSWS
jgi:hypothetical protein